MSPKRVELPSGEIRWVVRYRAPDGSQPKRRFRTKGEAVKFEAKVVTQLAAGGYVDPREQRQTFRVIAERHWASHEHELAEDTTRPRKRGVLDNHILPALGDYPIGAIRPSTISAAVAAWSRTLAPGSVRLIVHQTGQILESAMADGVIASNPARAKTVRTPKRPRRRDVHLSDEDARAILAATPEHYRPLVLTLVGTGLRIGEACGLHVDSIDFLRRTLRIRSQRRPGGQLGRLKNDPSNRDIPVDDAVLTALSEQIRQWPRQDGLVFCSSIGRPLTRSTAGHVFDGIEQTTGITVSPHSCRHYFGASLISRGVSVAAVSRWMGHSSPKITWDVYAYMMKADEDAGRAALRDIASKIAPAGVSLLCHLEGSE